MRQQLTDQSLLREEAVPQAPIECLGMMFENDEARRVYFLAKLREGLEELHIKLSGVSFTTVEDAVARMQSIETWPMGDKVRIREIAERMRHAAPGKDLLQRWKDEVGFPHGEIEDILRLSDPPYYIACPNPFIGDFIKHYGKPYDPDDDDYCREPFAADVSEGKGDRNYFIHTYHVKIPPSAVTRFAQHYTEPGDVTLDCFCGSGMTALGVSLAHNNRGKTVMADLSPSATFISYFHSLFRLTDTEISRLENVTASLQRDYQAWYQTKHNGWLASANAPANWQRMDLAGTQVGTIKYVVWSDVVCCPICSHSATLWDFCVDLPKNEVKDVFPCPSCSAIMVKEKKYAKGSGAHLVARVYEAVYDVLHGKVQRRFKRLPVLISYEYEKRRYEKAPDPDDLACIQMAEAKRPSSWCPTDRMPEGDESRRNDEAGLTHVHHFFPARSLHVLADAFSLLRGSSPGMLGFATSIMQRCTWQNRYMPQHRGNRSREVVGPLSGTLYIPSFSIEINPVEYLHEKGMSNLRLLLKTPHSHSAITTQSASSLFMILPDCSIDYAFIDPPFGANLQYSELNFIMEAWLKVWTSNRVEAVVNQKRLASLDEYTERMKESFESVRKALKPGRWVTLEFHNSQNTVWTAIQVALAEAGLIIADVRTLDKKKGTTKQLTLANTVRQDLIISSYKPNGGLEERFRLFAGAEEGIWDFIRAHLRQLPVFVPSKDGQAEVIAERMNYLLFDRMVAFHVQRHATVPLSASEFYAGLTQRFPERDGMYFLPEQIVEYDKNRMTVKEILQIELFVTNESSAIQWLRQQLTRKPQTFQELHPQFLRELGGWQKHETPLELFDLLEENFLCYDGRSPIPEQIWSWMQKSATLRERMEGQGRESADVALRAEAKDRWYIPDPNKAQDLEKLRERNLLREYEEYKAFKGRQLKVFRLEAVRAGFKTAWAERDYQIILDVAAKIPEQVLQEDPKLLMWYDQALTRLGYEG